MRSLATCSSSPRLFLFLISQCLMYGLAYSRVDVWRLNLNLLLVLILTI